MSTQSNRRAKGSGSIRPRGENRWEIRFDGPPGLNGKSKKVYETVKGSRRQADKILRERLAAVDQGTFITKTTETVAEFLDRWFELYAEPNCRPKTLQGYAFLISRYVKPTLGNIQLQTLQPQHIQGMFTAMREDGLSARTIKHTYTVFRQSLTHAVRWGDLVRNPTDATTPPRPVRKEMKVWDVDSINKFIELSKDNPYHHFYRLAILTGMRRGELAALKWDRVDVDNAQVSVSAHLQRITGSGLVEGMPKSAQSRRTIALSPLAVELLREIWVAQAEQRLLAGPVWQDTGYVFTQDTGKSIDPARPTREFARIIRDNDLPHMTLHGLRHAHATLMLSAGVHPKVVQERLGHAGVGITLDLYSHVVQGMQESAALLLDERLGNG